MVSRPRTVAFVTNGEASNQEEEQKPLATGFNGQCKIKGIDDVDESFEAGPSVPSARQRRKNRRRCVTYPSFAYNANDSTKRKNTDYVYNKDDPGVNWSQMSTRLLKNRSYANPEPFQLENISRPPTLLDLSMPKRTFLDTFLISTPASMLAFAVSYLAFPFIVEALNSIIKTSPSNLIEIVQSFAPGISILYGTFVSLTLSTLYNRQRTIQDGVVAECAYLTVILRSMLNLFKDDACKLQDAGQCVADQIRTLVKSSRGEELMGVMYSDPYARMAELIDIHEEDMFRRSDAAGSRIGSQVGFARDTVRELARLRSRRLSDETLALPPTHFRILNVLTMLILLSFSIAVVPTVDPETGAPPNVSSLLFGSLATIYVLFYNFATDLNNPFQGVYQIRRSCAASHMMEAKWVIANHRMLKGKVDFEEIPEEDGAVLVRSPGVGDFYFDRDAMYQDTVVEDSLLDLP